MILIEMHNYANVEASKGGLGNCGEARMRGRLTAVSRVAMKPYVTALHLIPRAPHSLATVLVSPSTPAFAVA